LLHEIHNRDEMGEKDNLYSYQMQREGSADGEDAEDIYENGGSKKRSMKKEKGGEPLPLQHDEGGGGGQ
jgi:hypothetical protein